MGEPLSDMDMVDIATYFHLAVKNSRDETLASGIETNHRIKLLAPVAVAEAPTAPTAARSAETVYNTICAACHASGVAGAPEVGDKAAWSVRIAQGNTKTELLDPAIDGLNAMQEPGSCSDCSDKDLKKVVEYMAVKSR